MDLVSIIIPAYNAEKYLRIALNSVLNQTYKNIELIVIDDGSKDSTPKILEDYVANYPDKMKVVTQENSGPSKARNKGIALAKGKYIAFLDSDDVWEKQKLEKQVSYMKAKEASIKDLGIIICNGIAIDKEGNYLKDVISEEYKPQALRTNLLFENCVKPTTSWLVKKSCFEDVGVFDEQLAVAEDWELAIRICLKYNYSVMKDKLFRYRSHQYSQSYFGEKNLKNELLFLKKIIDTHYSNISFVQKRKAYGFRYRAAAIAYRENGHKTKTFLCILQFIWYYPPFIFSKLFVGLIKYFVLLPFSWINSRFR